MQRLEGYPTVASLRSYLKAVGWEDEEIEDLLKRRENLINADGTTRVSFEAWTWIFKQEPEPN
jgi:hypothetical protein